MENEELRDNLDKPTRMMYNSNNNNNNNNNPPNHIDDDDDVKLYQSDRSSNIIFRSYCNANYDNDNNNINRDDDDNDDGTHHRYYSTCSDRNDSILLSKNTNKYTVCSPSSTRTKRHATTIRNVLITMLRRNTFYSKHNYNTLISLLSYLQLLLIIYVVGIVQICTSSKSTTCSAFMSSIVVQRRSSFVPTMPLTTTVILPTTTSHTTSAYDTRQQSYLNNPRKQQQQLCSTSRLWMSSSSDTSTTNNKKSSPPPDSDDRYRSNDPYYVLNVPRTATKQEIKRAYKKLALQYHPDMVTTKDSSQFDKKRASDWFAKINWAYETAMSNIDNPSKASSTSYTSSSSSSSRSSSSSTASTASDGWVPPHRRTGSYSSNTSSGSTSSSSSGSSYNNKDPFSDEYYTTGSKGPYSVDDKEYDTNGDSLEKIFTDLFTGVAAVSAAGIRGNNNNGGILSDFVDFLERTVDGYSSSSSSPFQNFNTNNDDDYNDDVELRTLLQSNNYNEIMNEMDETELIVQQLTTKLQQINDEIIMVQAEIQSLKSSSSSGGTSSSSSTYYTDRIKNESRNEELQSQKNIVTKYRTKAQKRLLKLQTKYKQLIVEDPSRTRSSSSSTWDDIKREYGSGSSGSVGSTNAYNNDNYNRQDTTRTSSNTRASNTDTSTKKTDEEEESWKNEGFGSFGRGRGSSNRQRRQQQQQTQQQAQQAQTTASTSSYSNPRTSTNEPSNRSTSTSSTSSSSSSTTNRTRPPSSSSSSSTSSNAYVDKDGYSILPPHRRPTSIYDAYQQKEEDQRRLREIKVDEEFDKLKRELGL